MKVIDIMQRVANGEKIRFEVINDIEYYCEENGLLHNEYGEEVEWLIDSSWLNKEVEIKEDKKIEKIDVNHLQTIKKWKRAKILGNKINEIIDYLEENK